MKGQKIQVLLWMAALLLFTEAAHAEVWQWAAPLPTQDQIDRALRLGDQFQEQAPASRGAQPMARTIIPPAYLAPSQPPPRTDTYYYNPYYNYCRQYPWAYQCRPYSYRYRQPDFFRSHIWKRHDDHRQHDRDKDKHHRDDRH
jgi:hypothetical protein